MNNKLLEKIKSAIDNIFYNKESLYKKHQTVSIAVKTKKTSSKSKNINSFLFICPHSIKDTKNRKILFFGSKTQFEENNKKQKDLIYGNDLEPKDIKRKNYKMFVATNQSVISKYKTTLLKTNICAKNQDSFDFEQLLNDFFAKYYQYNNSFVCKVGDFINNTKEEIYNNILKVLEQIGKENNIQKIYIYRNMCKSLCIDYKIKT